MKIKKMKNFLFIILAFPFLTFGQRNYIKINGYHDQSLIESLKKENIEGKSFLVFQSGFDKSYSSILIMQGLRDGKYWVIKDDSIVLKGSKNVNNIFNYKDFLKTGAIKKEDKLKFTPPIIGGGKETDLVIYEDKYQRFYFEHGKNLTGYVPDSSLEIFRREWLNIIRNEIRSIMEEHKQ